MPLIGNAVAFVVAVVGALPPVAPVGAPRLCANPCEPSVPSPVLPVTPVVPSVAGVPGVDGFVEAPLPVFPVVPVLGTGAEALTLAWASPKVMEVVIV
jgi:hypothetical protein